MTGVIDSADGVESPSTRVLVVEDEPQLCELVRYELQDAGYEAAVRSDGRVCWDELRTGTLDPDAIVLDVVLPGLDGFTLLERLRSCERYEDVPVLLLTALGRERDVVRGFELGADEYVTKPFSSTELVARLERQLER